MKKFVITEDDVKSLADVITDYNGCVQHYINKKCDSCCDECWKEFLINQFTTPYTKECTCPSEAARRQVLLENMTEDV